MNESQNNNTTTWRLSQLEKQYDEVDDKLSKILNNHLPHLQIDLVSLKTRINVLTAINVGAIIIGILLARVL